MGSTITIAVADYFGVSIDEMIGRSSRAQAIAQEVARDKSASKTKTSPATPHALHSSLEHLSQDTLDTAKSIGESIAGSIDTKSQSAAQGITKLPIKTRGPHKVQEK